MNIVKKVREGDMLPPFYGVAWINYSNYSAVCLPVPLNIIAGIGRNAYAFLRFGYKPIYMLSREAYLQGFRDGKKKGYLRK